MSYLSAPVIKPADQPREWLHIQPLSYQDQLGLITVQPGAFTDGASIPRPLWSLIGSPMQDHRVFRAAAIHDQLYKSLGYLHAPHIAGGYYSLTRSACDAIFRRALIEAGIPRYKARLYWAGVRTGGWVGWRRYAKHPKRAEAERALITLS